MKNPIVNVLMILLASWGSINAQTTLTGSLTNGLVAYYPLNGDAKDYSSNSNNGIVHGAYASNSAFYFDGSSYIQAGNIIQDYSSNATISCWVKTSTGSAGMAVSKQLPYPSASGFALAVGGSNTVGLPTNGIGIATLNTEPGSNPGWSGRIVANVLATTQNSINDNQWHLLTATVDGSTLKIYLDGLLISSQGYKSDSLQCDQPMLIGCSVFPWGPAWNVPRYYTGFIKNVLAYNRSLSSKEIARLYSSGIAPVTSDIFGSGTNQFSIDFVQIGNAGNSNDTTGYGGVPYSYRIGKYDISAQQITAALRIGANWLGDQPGTINWYGAAAFVNWLNANAGYQPAYNLFLSNGVWHMGLWSTSPDSNGNVAWTLGGTNLYRNANCAYFLPSENEWYKAAYYDPHKNGETGGYWLYPTGSDIAPTPVASGTNAGTAVFNGQSHPASVFQAGGLSSYGTMGQGGNVWQWMESAFDGRNTEPSEYRTFRGGNYPLSAESLSSANRNMLAPDYPNFDFGFRVASIDDSWLTNGLLAYYPFDGDARDYSGNGKDLYTRNCTFPLESNSYSVKLTPQSSVYYNNVAGTNTTRYFSFSLWVKYNSFGSSASNSNDQYLLYGGGNLGPGSAFLRLLTDSGTNSINFGYDISSGTVSDTKVTHQSSLATGVWNHIVCTRSDSNSCIYVNGKLITNVVVGPQYLFNTSKYTLGNSASGQYPSDANLQEVRIYSRTLSSSEVAGLYELDGGVLPPPLFSQTILFPELSPVTYGVPPFTLSATSSSDLPVSFSSSSTNISIAGNTVTVLGTGTATIIASQPGDDTYAAAPSVTNSLVVNGASSGLKIQTISFPPLKPKSWTNAPFALTAKASSKLPITYTSSDPTVATVSGAILTPVGVGTTTITAYQGGNTIYNPATPVSQPQVITQAGQKITFAPIAPHTYGDAPFSLSASSSSSLPISYASSATNVATVSGNVVTIVGAGTTKITASQSGNALYTSAPSVTQALKVAKANQTVTFNPTTPVVYTNGGTVNFNGTASSGLPLTYKSSAPKVITVLTGLPRGVMIGRGMTIITAAQAGDANYNKASATNSITIQ